MEDWRVLRRRRRRRRRQQKKRTLTRRLLYNQYNKVGFGFSYNANNPARSLVHRRRGVSRILPGGLVATPSYANAAVLEHSEGGGGITRQEKAPHDEQHALLRTEKQTWLRRVQ